MKSILFCIFVSLAFWGFSQKPKNKRDKEAEKKALAQHQVARMGADYFKQENLTGKGVRIAVFDLGFRYADKHPAFEHIRKNIVAAYNFRKKSENVYRRTWHGTAVLSNIAGKMDSLPLGLAPDAEFLLAIPGKFKSFRRDKSFNKMEVEIRRMVDWAYEHNAQIISLSIGINPNVYFRENMDGQTCFFSRATQYAAEKGILVVASAGNSGNNSWQMITAPADAENVITVGGINPNTQIHSKFSSFGPSADGRLKPNVSANGTTIAAVKLKEKKQFRQVDGTSLSAPLVAGFAACVWQANPNLKAHEISKLIQESGELYPYFDYAHGYGVPNAWHFDKNSPKPSKFFDFIEENDVIRVQISDDIVPQLGKSNIFRLYYHLQKPNGLLSEYAVIEVFQRNPLTIPKDKLEDIKQISVHFLGYTQTYEIR
jgi:subtilisin family serine protease